ncbi:MAG: tetratricopeptide repeat protein [Planctomycetota bacterium]
MSWHTSMILIQQPDPGDFVPLLERLGFSGGQPNETVSFEDATSSMALGKSVAHADGWTIICDPMFFTSMESLDQPDNQVWSPSLDQRLREISASGATVFGFITEGASGTHGFTLYQNGNRKRMWLVQSGNLLADEGTPLPEEKECFGKGGPFDEEQGLLMLMEKICVPFDTLDRIEFQLFEDHRLLLMMDPKSGGGGSDRGNTDWNVAEYDKAIADLTDTIWQAHYNRAHAYFHKGEYDKAIADYTEAIRLNLELRDAYRLRGHAYMRKRELDQAITDFSESIRLAPNDGEGYFSRACAHVEKGDRVRSDKDFAQAEALGYKPK